MCKFINFALEVAVIVVGIYSSIVCSRVLKTQYIFHSFASWLPVSCDTGLCRYWVICRLI